MRLFLFALLLTATAHAQWDIQNSGTTADLRGIASIGAGIAWASGTNGTVLRTEDGGYLWQRCTVPPGADKLDFRGIQAFDANMAIVMSSGPGDLSRLYKTIDGCQTWKLEATNPDKDGFWDAISVWSFDYTYKGKPAQFNGWVLGDPVGGHFRVFKFEDGFVGTGKYFRHFHSLEKDDDPSLAVDRNHSAAFAASNTSFISIQWVPKDGKNINNGTIWPVSYMFVTGGKNGAKIYTPINYNYSDVVMPTRWRVQSVPVGSSTESSGAFSIALAPDHQAGAIVGGDYSKPNSVERTAAYFQPSTTNWLPATTPPHGYRSAVAYDAEYKTWITVGPNGTDISTDDGRNWRALKPGPNDPPDADQHWNALSLPFVVGPHGRIGLLNPAALQPATLRSK